MDDGSAKSKIAKMEFKYFAIDINKYFEQNLSTCNSKEQLQLVVVTLNCEGMIGSFF